MKGVMKDEIQKGSIVRPVHCERSKYMGNDFREWIDRNSETTFYVESKVGNCCRLKRVFFLITDEFLEKV